jgi:uncharacterized membrane-anchored protein YhcB (DUF1043 family)
MESIDPLWVFGGIMLLAGALLGAVVYRRFTPSISDVNELRAELARSRSEMERYRTSVNGHFNKTSELVKELTEDYVKVYRHLAEGAQTLSDTPEFSHVLEQQKGRVLISTDGEAGSQDIEAAHAGDVPAQGDAAEDAEPRIPDPGMPEDDAHRESSAAADENEPIRAAEDDAAKAAAGGDQEDDRAQVSSDGRDDDKVSAATDGVDEEDKVKKAAGSADDKGRVDPMARTDTQ